MKISPEKLAAEAEATGFRPDVLEKVAYLLGLLDAIRSHPFLKEKLVLKGGTALNLFIFDVPRLSVDIDLNYVGAEDRDGRPDVRKGVEPLDELRGVLGEEDGHVPVQAAPRCWASSRWASDRVKTYTWQSQYLAI